MLTYIANFVLLWIGATAKPTCSESPTTAVGTIQSPGWPNNFPSDSRCTWNIIQDKGKWIQINVTDVEIINPGGGFSEGYLNIQGFPSIRGRNKPMQPLATNNEAKITFVGTGSSGKGFSLRYQTISCTEIRKEESGEIVSPNYPFNYPHDVDCTWTIETYGDRRVKVEFHDFNIRNEIDCTGDSLKLIDATAQQEYLSGVYCGKMTPSTAYSKSNKLILKFKTNNNAVSSGFRLKYSTVRFSELPPVTPYPDPCNIQLTAASGIIKSPNYPQSLLTDRSCAWTIQRSKGEWIQYMFLDFDINDEDKLNVTEERDFIDLNSGKRNAFQTFATKNYAVIKFKANGDKRKRGFLLSYTAISCNKVINGGSGVILSPNYPIKYPKFTDCTWMIKALPGKKVYVEFLEIDTTWSTDCRIDAVTLVDRLGGNKKYTFCGRIKPSPTVSTGNELWIQFQSNTSEPKRGFALKYDTEWFGSTVITPVRPSPLRPIGSIFKGV